VALNRRTWLGITGAGIAGGPPQHPS